MYDISTPIRTRMAGFPGDPEVRVESVRSISRGDPYSVSRVTLSSHTGTHIDPPSHFLPGGAAVDELDVRRFNGPCFVLQVAPSVGTLGPAEAQLAKGRGERILFRTSNSVRWSLGEESFEEYVALSPEGAEVLLDLGVHLVGIDALSIERDPSGSFPVHRRLLGADCLILEGVRLAEVPPGPYELRCLPLRIERGDGGPARALLLPG